MKIQPLILCGGSGTRLWPLSREQYPKQLLSLTQDKSLLQATALRVTDLAGDYPVSTQPFVICNEEYRFIVLEQLRQIGLQPACILLEPAGRNTAPAVTIGAIATLALGEDALLLVMPADHVIADRHAFQSAILRGVDVAASGSVVTFGIVPDRAETGYGYIQAGQIGETDVSVSRIVRFVEKPDVATARQYVASGEYVWNSGIFLLRASVWLKAIGKYRSDVLAACTRAYSVGRQDADFYHIGEEDFLASPSDSIDYAVMEHLPDVSVGIDSYVVRMSCGWSDIGAWDSLWQAADKDAEGNVVRGDVMLQDSRGSLIMAESRLVAGIGLDDLVVVETADAVMVAHKSQTQEVKKIVDRLKAEKRPEANAHRKIHRPWGHYDSIDMGDRFQVKRIVVSPGACLSLQMHHHRAEHWIVVRGTARVTRAGETFLLSENQSTYIPLGTKHRLENPGKMPLEIIEVQSGAYLGEDDIVRFEDTYGR
jgi:mannose-1-phosphate guanylyltransferase/mannose-6-phosphate isomerase